MARSGSRTGGRESGAVLIAVMGLGAVLAVVAASATGRTVAAVRAASAAVAREEALHAAESVVLAVLGRLEGDVTGWTDPAPPDPGVLGHGWRSLDAALAGVPGPPGSGDVHVRTSVERVGPGPALRIVGEARVGRHVRAVEAVARPSTVADHAWATVHAVVDPTVTGGDTAACGVHRWTPSGLDADGAPVEPEVGSTGRACIRTRLDASLAVGGAVHLDDLPRIDFAWAPRGPMTTAAPAPALGAVVGPHVVGADDAASVTGPFGMVSAPPLGLPSDPFAGLGEEPVCRLRGPTLIRFDGAEVRVTSPLSHPRHDGAGRPAVHCPGLDRTDLDGIAIVLLPGTAVIQVRADATARCAEHPLGIDPSEDAVAEQGCGDGTAYVWGAYLGHRTVQAEDDVQIVWDVAPGTSGGAEDAGVEDARLALVAGGSVVLRRPLGPPLRVVAPFGTDLPFAGPGIPPFGAHPLDAPTPTSSSWSAPRIVAVLAALGGSVRVQNPHGGIWSDVPIVIEGAVAQRFVGPTLGERRDATGSLQARTGRPLEVRSDARLSTSIPPALPRIRDGRLRVLTWAEVRPTASEDGP